MKLSFWISFTTALSVVFSTPTKAYVCQFGTCNEFMLDRVCERSDPNYATRWRSNSTHINLGLATSLTTFFAYFSEELRIGAFCAMERLNSESTYNFDVVLADDVPINGIEAGYCFGEAGVPIVAGPVSSSKAASVSMVGRTLQTHYIGIWPTSGLLSNKDPQLGYPTFSRVIANDMMQGVAVAKFCKKMGWNRIATLTHTGSTYGEGVISALVKLSDEYNVHVQRSATVRGGASDADIEEQLNLIRNSGLRVILVAFAIVYEGAKVFDAMDRLGMLNGEFVMIAGEPLLRQVVLFPKPQSDGVFVIPQTIEYDMSEGSEFKYLHDCFYRHENDTTGPFAGRSTTLKSKSFFESWTAFAYDAFLLAGRIVEGLGVDDMSNMSKIRTFLTGYTMNGASGKLILDENGDRSGAYHEVLNMQNGRLVSVAKISSVTDEVIMDPVHKPLFFNGTKVVPKDFSMNCQLDVHYQRVAQSCFGSAERNIDLVKVGNESIKYCPDEPPLTVPCDYPNAASAFHSLVVISIGLGICFIYFVLLIKNYHHASIKNGQAIWLVMLVIGSTLTIASPLLAFGEVSPFTCFAPIFGFAIGTLLQFGTLALKSLRVSKIMVRNSNLSKVIITNGAMARQLIAILMGMVLIGILQGVLDPPTATQIEMVVGRAEKAARVPVYICESADGTLASVLYGYLIVVIAYTCKVSYEIRNVHDDYSEAFYIFIATYNATLNIGAYLAFGSLSVQTRVENHFVLCLTSTIASLGMSGLVLIPKFLKVQSHSRSRYTIGSTSNRNDSTKIAPSVDTEDAAQSVQVVPFADQSLELKQELKRAQEKISQLQSELAAVRKAE